MSKAGEHWPVVAIPARNEERRLPALLAALAGQSWQRHSGRPLAVVIVLNNCVDGSSAAVAAAIDAEPRLSVTLINIQLPAEDAHVGNARRLAMDTALASAEDRQHCAILTTDADAVPPSDWVDANLRHLNDVDLVGGIIRGNEAEEAQLGPGFRRRASLHLHYAKLTDRLAAWIDPIEHDPWPRHRDHTGASLAVRADVYAAVGGLPTLPLREDIAFVSKVVAAGYRLRHPLDVRIDVSARLVGRAKGGMADCLKEWMREEALGTPLLVEDPLRVIARLSRRRRLRQLEHASVADRVALAYEIGVDPGVLCDSGGNPLPGARLVEGFAVGEPDAAATVPIDAAIAAVEVMLGQIREIARAA
ncbi:hypothetical protein Sa4125_08360 [Aureimonas sp. SA4125]|uniref:glycosyltransferase n=1 Tax=Aureimonas sp. SA4125 TaxID=2826993 RepID=UPI001CC7DE2A|nr:glycosyltransferase [Aureimonas sp. SA4125]BDA83294.1 hypothetical protein Sa4125_08360 [Aureimonas sp. SA4125]